MATVVSDTSPIRALAHLNHLDLLYTLFGQVLVSPAVRHELLQPPPTMSIVDVGSFSYLHVQSPQDQAHVLVFRNLHGLDPGESEALALACELPAPLLLVDEAKARGVAQQLSIPLTGTLGILLRAKQQALLTSVGPLLDCLINDLKFFISPPLRAFVLAQAGE